MKRREFFLAACGSWFFANSCPAVGTSGLPAKQKVDVLIVGGGIAGFSAAYEAGLRFGSNVVILEKGPMIGGRSVFAAGSFNAVDPERQKKFGIEDSVELMTEQVWEWGGKRANKKLVRVMAENSTDAVTWLENLGIRWLDRIFVPFGGAFPRAHTSNLIRGGYEYFSAINRAVRKLNVKVLLNTEATELLVNSKGEIRGVSANRKGRKILFETRAVVLATGGFGANVKFRQEVNTGVWKEVVLDKSIGTTNINKAAQGDGLVMAKKIGAQLIGLSDIQLHPNGTPGTGLMQDIATSGRNRIFVNLEGNRFVNEGAARDTLCKAIFKQPKGKYWLVMNKLRYPDINTPDRMGVTMKDMLALGRVKTAATLDELAKVINVPADNLKAAVAEYNKAASHQVEKDKFGFAATNTDDAPMTEGPWYACLKVPTVHHTMGGVKINTKAEVIGTDGKPIQGLFAAGEVTGGIHGANRLGGNAIADVYTFGRQAGASAAKFAK